MIEPEVVVTVKGKIKDFRQIDNLYTVMKREGSKLLEGWEIEILLSYRETEIL